MEKVNHDNLDMVIGTKDRVSGLVAEHIIYKIQKNNGKIVLGAAGGSSTAGVYAALRESGIDMSGITAFTPDEYFGTDDQLKNIQKQLPGAKVYAPDAVCGATQYRDATRHDDRLYLELLMDSFSEYYPLITPHYEFGDQKKKDEAKASVNALVERLSASCRAYEKQIADAGDIDILLLGLGLKPDGHIASIMPGKLSVDDRTHIEKYLEPHKVSTGETEYAITMGIGTILEAKEIALLAFGENKADAVEKALYGPIDDSCPASYLRKSANRLLICLDHAAAENICEFHRSSMEI